MPISLPLVSALRQVTKVRFGYDLTWSLQKWVQRWGKVAIVVLYSGLAAKSQCPLSACLPGSAPASNQSFGMGIFRVQLASLDTTTNGTADGYRDYSCGHGALLQRSSSYTLAVRTNPNVDENVRAWIDFDNNGLFAASELVLASTGRQHQASFTVPATAVVGAALRLRIAADYVNATVPTPCSTPQYSQTEDYRVVVATTAPSRPVARFAALDTVSCGATIAFRDQSLNAPTAWRWTFGDGTSSTQQSPQHTYALPGTYAVRLRTCNASGCDSLTKINYILVRADAPLAARCQPATLGYCCGFGLIRFRLGVIDRASADGAAGYEDFSCAQRTVLTADRPYTLQLTTGANAHDVRVYLDRNDNGQFDLPAELLYEGLAVHNPSVVVQLASGSGLVVGRPLRLRCWVDAAGNTSFGPCVSPQQGQVEDYSVVVAANTAAPSASFNLTYQQLCGPVQVALTNTTTGGSTRYAWDFGDGGTSTAAVPPAHTYATGGLYDVTLVAANAYGSDTVRHLVAVASNCPGYCVADGRGGSLDAAAYFTRVQVGAIDNRDVRQPGQGYRDFTTRYTELRQGQSYSVRTESPPWRFAGNGPWARVTGWIDYNQNGVFEASELLGRYTQFSPLTFTLNIPLRARPGATRLRLQICNENEYWPSESCPPDYFNVSTEDYTVVILPALVAPRAGFNVDLTPVCTGTVQLRDTSWAAPTAWYWTFGDGSTSTQQNPQHTYANSGTYTVALQASNAYGTSTLSRSGYVTVGALAAAPGPAQCVPPAGVTGSARGIGTCAIGPFLYTGTLNDAGYRDETCSRGALQLTRGVANPVRVTALRSGSSGVIPENQVFMWLDANNDGRFDRLNELVYSSLGQGGHQDPKTGSLTVPATALLNRPLRLRVAWDGDAPTVVPEPCYRQSASQVRDFTATVTSALGTTPGNTSSVTVYPNPSNGHFTLQSNSSLQGAIQVRNTTGQLVFEQVVSKATIQNLDLHQLPAGVYFMHIPQSQLVRKITIMH